MITIAVMDTKISYRDSEMTDAIGRCYLCKEKNLVPVAGFPWLVECLSCGMVFNPDLSFDSREVAERFYDELNVAHRKRINSVLHRVARARWRWVQERIPLQDGRLLEIGCGTGEFLVAAKNAGWQVDGLELSEKFRGAAKQWYNLEVRGEGLIQANYLGETFDVVALLHVFEHLTNPLEFLKQVSRIAKPGGWLFIVVPNLASWTDSVFGKASPTLIKPDHFFHYNRDTLQEMMNRSDFIPIEIETIEPAHHLWTSLAGYLSQRKQSQLNGFSPAGQTESNSLIRQVKSNLPYWVGVMTSGLLFPVRFWLQKNSRGHEIYLLCRKRL